MNLHIIKAEEMKLFFQGAIACIPTLLSYWAVGFACGAIGKISGFSLTEIALLSMFLYAGSAQFLFYSLAKTGADITHIACAVAFINMRYLLITAYMSQFFSHSSSTEKLIGGLMITDETFGVASSYAKKNKDELPFYWLFGLNLTAWVNWMLSTIVGCLFASILPGWLNYSLGFSLVGMFAGLLLLSWFVSHTRILDIIVMAIAILVILTTHNTINFNIATILSTITAATAGMLFLIWKPKRNA
ncbi:MAG: Azaleucine resistance protein AzlC [Candidatus Tokpelaia sp. JSC161]|jgi:predicted branched-subunit amino acid permease|nr:MAG: Azaleucine resistance protein AzlC [Candidatus Tokpelaia sp. JSC161]